eukprot:474829_1
MALGLKCRDVIRILLVLLSGFLSLSVIGFQALLPVLQSEGIFSSLCHDKKDSKCNSQSLRLNLMFIVTISVMNMFCMVWGGIIQFKGEKASVIGGGVIMAVSALLFGFGNDWLCFFSYIGIGIGSFGVLFGAVSVPPQYPQIAGSLSSLFTGSMDASAGVFYIFYIIYDHSNISMQQLFITFSILLLIITLALYFYVFSSIFYDEQNQSLVNDTKSNYSAQENVSEQNDEEDVGEIVKSKKFLCIVVWSSFYMITKYFYIATVNEQLDWINNYNNHHLVTQGQHIFSIMLLCSGVFTIITGPVIDKFGLKVSLCTMGVTSLIVSILSIVKIYHVQYVTMLGM